MKIERLRKSHKKEIIIGIVLLVIIGGALTFKLTHSKYRFTQSIDLASGVIHYKASDFQIMAIQISDDGENYVNSDAIPIGSYIINEEKTYCKTISGTEVKGKIKTENGKHVITDLEKGDKCYLYFDKGIPLSTIISNIANNAKISTPDFSQVSTTDEGIYRTYDEMYGNYTYYWRGAVIDNYVNFAGFCWRIVRINGDNTVRLIYDGKNCHANGTSTSENIAANAVYNTSMDQSYYAGWTYTTEQRPSTLIPQTKGTSSNAKRKLEEWYSSNINGTNAAKVVLGKYCNDRNAGKNSSGVQGTWSANGALFYYAGYDRRDDYNPTLGCPNGDIYELNVGLITIDELIYAGGGSQYNKKYYLYNGQNYWTMTPGYWSSSSSAVYVVGVNSDGQFTTWSNTSYAGGLRPVINLKSDIVFASGNGTQSLPYIVVN